MTDASASDRETTQPLKVLDLFSGIGGFSLGLERAGMKTVAFCEIDPYCCAVLKKHWPDIRIYEDVTALTGRQVSEEIGCIDVICGGFPCQDISVAGKQRGIDGERSGLWREYARLIGELRPRYAIVENVANLLVRGIDRVLGDLAALGYDAEWHCIPASAVGAPHERDRIWIVAYLGGGGEVRFMADTEINGRISRGACNATERTGGRQSSGGSIGAGKMADTIGIRTQVSTPGRKSAIEIAERSGWWSVEPDVGRVAHGVSSRAHRLNSLGNAVVPQIPEIIGRAIIAAEAAWRC